MGKLALVRKIEDDFEVAAQENASAPLVQQQQQQRPRYATQREEEIARAQQQWDGFGPFPH